MSKIFLHSIAYVLGFSVVFSSLGIILQTLLWYTPYDVMYFLSKVGGVLLIFFGIYTMDLIKIPWFEKSLKYQKHRGKISYAGSFLFGAVFAAGWTPCIGPILGAILSLAAASPAQAFPMLLAYSIGIGIPFLLVGIAVDKSQKAISKIMQYVTVIRKVFGVVIIVMGIGIITGDLYYISSITFPVFIQDSLLFLANTFAINIAVAFLAGVLSFLSPCVLPLVPGFLAYLAGTTLQKKG